MCGLFFLRLYVLIYIIFFFFVFITHQIKSKMLYQSVTSFVSAITQPFFPRNTMNKLLQLYIHLYTINNISRLRHTIQSKNKSNIILIIIKGSFSLARGGIVLNLLAGFSSAELTIKNINFFLRTAAQCFSIYIIYFRLILNGARSLYDGDVDGDVAMRRHNLISTK